MNVKEELNLEEIDTEIEENIVESSEISIQSLENTIVVPMDLSVEMVTAWYKSKKTIIRPCISKKIRVE